MKSVFVLLLLLAGCAAAPAVERHSSPDGEPLRVMSFNVRFDNPEDGPHAWPNRRELVRQVIRFHDVHLLGAQEVLDGQVQQLAEDLADFAWFGVGRADGDLEGEYAPIFFRRDRLELLEGGTLWLSETPHEPGSKGWDAELPRIVTWARLRDRSTGRSFLAMNTHFDHAGAESRRQSAQLIVRSAQDLAGDLPVVLMGDLNVEPDSDVYRTFTEALVDVRELSEQGSFGPDGTFGTFEPRQQPARRIDYIFVSPGIRVIREGTLAHHWDGRHASDHWPVMAELVLESGQRAGGP